jgi:SAM-dependent methyltransferase
VPGVDFGYFGRALGWRLVWSGAPWGLGWVANPVSVVRYFEFDFARRCLEAARGDFLDIASPRLFSFWMASRGAGPITVMNPDAKDLRRSEEAARRLGLTGLAFEAAGADALAGRAARYEAIWSLSVMEHIEGAYDEREALRLAWSALRPGGRLVITVPVAPAFAIETRREDPYGTQARRADGRYFFQRTYDKQALDSRLSATLNATPEREEYFGERAAGTYAAYEARWIERGIEETVADPRFIADQFVSYPSHAAMPGMGVAGLCYVKARP